MIRPPIVLLTDFGYSDSYVGEMKGVILSLFPKATIVDLCHDIRPQDIRQAARVLKRSYRFFPKGSIFVCVIDPGVGTKRDILCMKTKSYYFLAPDNGLLSVIEAKNKIRSVSRSKFFLSPNPSSTFHGRDIFAPTAARLAKNGSLFGKLGKAQKSMHRLKFPQAVFAKNSVTGEVIDFDRFGNAQTNISYEDGKKRWAQGTVFLAGKNLGKIRKNYAESPHPLTALWDSAGILEIARPGGSAQRHGIRIGQKIQVRF